MKRYLAILIIILASPSFFYAMELAVGPIETKTTIVSDKDEIVTMELLDEKSYKLELKLALLSKTLSLLIEEAGSASSIPLPDISKKTFSFIHEQLKQIGALEESPGKQEERGEKLDTVRNTLIKTIQSVDTKSFVALIHAVNYLHIPLLYDVMLEQCNLLNLSEEQLNDLPLDLCRPLILKTILKDGPLHVSDESLHSRCTDFWVTAVCVSDDKIISSSFSGSIDIWNLATGKRLAKHKSPTADIYSLCLAGDTLFFGSKNSIRALDIKTGKQRVFCSGHAQLVTSVWRADNILVSASYDHTIRLWNHDTGEQVGICNGHTAEVNSVCVAGNRIVSGSHDGTIRVWDRNTQEQIFICENPLSVRYKDRPWSHRGRVAEVCIVGNKIISGSHDETIAIWDLTTGTQLASGFGHEGIVRSVCGADNLIISGGQDGSIIIWELSSGRQLAKCTSARRVRKSTDTITQAVIAQDKIIASSNFKDHTICVWDLSALKQLYTLDRRQVTRVFNYLKKNTPKFGHSFKALADLIKEKEPIAL